LSMECANSSTVQSASIIAQSVSSGQAPNIIIAQRSSNSANTEKVRIDSNGNVGINESAPSEKLQVKGDVLLGSTGGDVALKFEYSDHQFAKIVGNGRDSSGYGDIDFYTSTGSGVSNLLQRMTIRSDGRVGINITDPDSYNNDADALVVSAPSGGGNNSGITIRSNYAGSGSIYFADGSSGNDAYKGYVVYNQPNDIMYLGVQNATKFQINANGALGLSGSNYGSSGQVLTSQGSGSAAVWAAASGGKVVNYDHTIVTAAGSASLAQGHYSNNIIGKSYAAASGSNKLILIAMVSVGYQHSQAIAARFTLSNNGIDASTGDASGSRRRATTAVHNQSQYQMESMTLVYVHSNPSTTALTYGVQLGQSDNGTQTVYWNRSQNDSNHNYRIRAATTLTIIELEG